MGNISSIVCSDGNRGNKIYGIDNNFFSDNFGFVDLYPDIAEKKNRIICVIVCGVVNKMVWRKY